MKDIIVENSLKSAREQANSPYQHEAMLHWYDGRVSAIALIHQDDLVAQGAENEIRFLIDYARRHGAKS